MSWIESHQKLKEDPKAAAVAAVMGWNLYECIGRLHVFWWWCVDHCEDGDLRRYNDVVIASVAGVAAPDAKRFVEAMANGCGTSERPDGFFERVPYFRIANWWKFTRRFMQKRYERAPEKWRAIARAYGSREGQESTGPDAESTAGPKKDSTNQPTNQPTNQHTIEVGGRGTILIAGAKEPPRSGRFEWPNVGGLPVPLYIKNGKEMVANCRAKIKAIKAKAKTKERMEVVGGLSVRAGVDYEPEAQAAIEAWEERIKEIERAMA